MKRIILLLAVMAILMLAVAAPAFAKQPENELREFFCKDPGIFAGFFKNQGQCVSTFNHEV